MALHLIGFGLWYQAECPVMFFLCAGAAAFIWLSFTVRTYPRLVLSTFKYPLVWSSLAIALVSLILCPFQPVPLVSFWGNPQMGEGILFYLAFAAIAAVLTIQSKIPSVKRALLYWAFFLGTIFSAMTIVGSIESPLVSMRGWEWSPYYFSDCTGFIGLAFILYCAYYFQDKKKKVPALILLSLCALFVFYYSYNKSLWYGFVLALGSIAGIKLLSFKSEKKSRALSAQSSYRSKKGQRPPFTLWDKLTFRTLFPIVSLVAVFGFVVVLGIASYLNVNIPKTLITRGHFIIYTFVDLFSAKTFQDYLTLLIGRGWGEYQEFIASNLFTTQISQLFEGAQESYRTETIKRTFFHSHNSLTGIFSALGFFGVFLQTLKIYFISKAVKERYKYVGAIFIISFWLLTSFWFELTATVPYSMLAFVLVTKQAYPRWKLFSLRQTPRFLRAALIGLAILLVLPIPPITLDTLHVSQAMRMRKSDDYLEKIDEMTKNYWIDIDHYFGFKRAMELVREISYHTLEAMEEGVFSINAIYEGNMKLAQYLYDRRLGCGNLFAMMVPLNIYSELASNNHTKLFFNKDKDALTRWAQMATTFVKCVPKRSDMTIPLLNTLLLKSKTREAEKVVHAMLKENPQDPVGLWFSGTLKIEHDETLHEGLKELKAAYKLGINRFMPIPESLISKLK